MYILQPFFYVSPEGGAKKNPGGANSRLQKQVDQKMYITGKWF